MDISDNDANCVICKYAENWVNESECNVLTTIKSKAIANIITISSETRKDGLLNYLQGKSSAKVHEKCRTAYIKVMKDSSQSKKRKCTSDSSNYQSSSDDGEARTKEFDFKKKCIICTKNIQKTQAFSVLTSKETKQRVLDYYTNDDSLNPVLREEMINKLLLEDDLSVLQARYHRKSCSSVLRLEERDVQNRAALRIKIKRSMEEIFNFIDDHEDDQFNLNDFHEVLHQNDLFIPSNESIWNKLKNHYQNDIVIIHKSGAQGYCCLKKKGYDILHRQHEESQDDSFHFQLIDQVAKIIFEEAKEYTTDDVNEYPASDSMFERSKKLPPKLEYLLEKLILNQYRKDKSCKHHEPRIISIAHAMMSAMFPRLLLSSLHIGVGVALHRKYGSRELIDMCHAMGFCCSYNEVRTYEISAAMQGDIELKSNAFVQFVADNADWNLRTLDGKGTFHSLGWCFIITPASFILPKKPFPRLKQVQESEIAARSKVEIQKYEFPPLEGLKYYNFPPPNTNLNLKLTDASKITIYWMFLKYSKPSFPKGLNGFIEDLTATNTDYEVSAINFMPFIHAYPSEYSTLYTVICQAVSEARKSKMNTCIITFDQPLYLKSRDIVGATQLDDEITVVIRLGGFHTLMSYLGSIGFIMKDSGLQEALSGVYGENTIKQIFSGHQYARAVRAHSLVLLALVKKIFSRIENRNSEVQSHVQYIKDYSYMLPDDMKQLQSDDIFKDVADAFETELVSMEKQNPTWKLWIQYCRMVFIVQDFIHAEKSGNWDLHLTTIERMIPFFHATGHFHYAKSAQLYLEDMKALKKKMDVTEYEKFTKGGFWTARRSDRFYSGIFTDQTIEQTLMRLLKFEGGLFRRGVTESVVYQWIRGFIFTKDIIESMEKFTNCSFDKNYQHKDLTDSRINLDLKSLKKIEEFFNQYDPFSETIETLICIANGNSATEKTNCHNAFEEGIEVMKDITGTSYKELKLSRSKIVKTIASSNSTVTIGKKIVEIDPDMLFHRICVMKKNDEEMQDYLKWELSPFPQAYFNTFGMLKNTKSDLFQLLRKVPVNVRDPTCTYYVIDGGLLIHKVNWKLGETFSSIMNGYINYIKKLCSVNCTVIFDGYESLTTKATERNRRAKHKASADVYFSENMPLKISKESFLLNTKNKIHIIKMLQNKLSEEGISFVQCAADADRTIVTTAIKIAEDTTKRVVVVSEDTDVVVLVVALTPINSEIFFLKPARSGKSEEIYSSKSLRDSPTVMENILFLHAFTGCDTVSATSNQGKIKFFKTFQNNQDLAIHAKRFKDVGLSVEEIVDHGSQLLLAMYNAPITFRKPNLPDEYTLSSTQLADTYRYRMYLTSVLKKKKVHIGKILSTVDAFTQHLKRVYLQVQNWLYGESGLNPTDWGWKLEGNFLIPVQMTLPPGPPSIMNLIFCGCKTDCGNSCGCRKHGLTCNLACQHCAGQNCTNIEYNSYEEEEEDVIPDTESAEEELLNV